MSAVPPSPANATILMSLSEGYLPFLFKTLIADSTPEATAAAFSKATCIHGTFHAVSGNEEVTISRHPVALAIIMSAPIAFVTCLTASNSPQP